MLGTSTKLARGPGLSILEWETFSSLPQQHKVEVTKKVRGGRNMMSEAMEALSATPYEERETNMAGWFGLFTADDQLMAVGHSV
mgnify:CR=1 FL=1